MAAAVTNKVVDQGLQYTPTTNFAINTGYWANKTASGVVFAFPVALLGFYVNSTTTGTIQLFDNASSASGPTGGIITPAVGFQQYPAVLLNGLFVNIAGTALDVTFFYQK